MLAQDDFQRADQLSWGVASDGQRWGASAGGTNAFAIVGGTGQVAGGGNATYPANLGPAVSDAEVLSTGVIVAAGGHWGAQLRNAGNGTNYAAMLDGTTISIRRSLAGAGSVLATTSFNAAPGTSYSLRFRAIGGTLKTRVWPTGSAEPSAWTLTASDAAPLGPGFGGLRFYVPSGSVAISSFLLSAM